MEANTSLNKVELISRQEGLRLVLPWPADVSYSQKFADLHKRRHEFESGFVLATYSDSRLIFPIQWGSGSAYSVHKGHTMPQALGPTITSPQWSVLSARVRELLKCDLYIADLAVSEPLSCGLAALPSAVFTLDIANRDIDSLFSACNKTTRNLIRRSQEQGFRVETLSGSMPQQYYELYVHHQRSMGTPPRLKEYFDSVADVFADGYVLIGVYDGTQLVGMNIAWCADNGLWLSINSSIAQYGPKHVNYLLYYETIKWACTHDIERIDFGGSPTRDGNIHNVFKLGFGATMTPLYRLTSGTFTAKLRDKIIRKKRALQIRLNKVFGISRLK